MLRKVETPEKSERPIEAAEAEALFDAAFGGVSHVVLAVSGGADSIALLRLAAEWAQARSAPRLSVATVHHGLRPEADQEVALVAAHAAALGLAHARLDAPLAPGATRIEETARDLRYAALKAHARALGADAIATAHTLDDQAETVLLRLAAGSGPRGLAGMRATTEREGLRHLRPLLGTPKSRLVASLRSRGLAWAEDAMNADPRFARARLRASRAALEREGLTPERLGTLAARLARCEAALESAVDAAQSACLAQDGAAWRIDPAAAALPAEIRLRLLERALAAGEGGRLRLDRVERLASRIAAEPAGVATLAGWRVAWTAEKEIRGAPAPARRWRGAPSGRKEPE
ncbi:tRNA lysidine(34) synthetase TilS [Hansschlegelia beijingensis]|uniref:tRNA(Ile)-lysidine synthase n=1 Tax=Hansschlegelia beijingensis TaxID=1133344 RepID=A0A7W6CZ92_9HYPH|nr:tRNA lysidine(34) synthetase TilS [Hansschlegelia beijingensis]MBB3971505.1 tRNA(Ile)-lysidine synthase [Hansschlegelia beijingensis]